MQLLTNLIINLITKMSLNLISTFYLHIQNELDIAFELESREFNNKWYTDVKAWKINVAENVTGQKPIDTDFSTEDNFDDDGLPF